MTFTVVLHFGLLWAERHYLNMIFLFITFLSFMAWGFHKQDTCCCFIGTNNQCLFTAHIALKLAMLGSKVLKDIFITICTTFLLLPHPVHTSSSLWFVWVFCRICFPGRSIGIVILWDQRSYSIYLPSRHWKHKHGRMGYKHTHFFLW